MNVFMIGGTGLLGSEGARELIRQGHSVTSIALPPLPQGAQLPEEMKIDFGNYMDLDDDAIRGYMRGCEGFVFAAGVDERVEGPPPIYEMFKKYNITPLERLLRIAKECGVKHVVICGSYFAYFDRLWPEKELARYHPYIRSRVDQENMALAFADNDFDVAILELPYIFGTQPGRKPVWLFLVEYIRNFKLATFYPRGGTAMVTVRQVGKCLAGALERNKGGKAYPVGYYNLTWKEMLRIMQKHMGVPNKPILTVPTWMYALAGKRLMRQQKAAGHEGGLDLVKFADLMCVNTFIDKETIVTELGAGDDDIDEAIGESVRLCLGIIAASGKDGAGAVIGMRGE